MWGSCVSVAGSSAISGKVSVNGREEPQQERRFASASERQATFVTDHFDHMIPEMKDQFGEAGFYYVGPLDMVRCFWCDGLIERWEEDDEPWREHAK